MIGAPGIARTDDAEAAARATVSVGMTVALAAIGMTFAALLLAYGIVRVQAPAWPPPGEAPLPPLWGLRLAATAAAVIGSVAMGRAARAVASYRGPAAPGAGRAGLFRALATACGAGLAFLLLQATALRALGAAGVNPGSGLAASVVYALTAFHGLHALCAVVLSLGLLAGARRRSPRATRVQAIAAFWHLVTVIWLIVFATVFVA